MVLLTGLILFSATPSTDRYALVISSQLGWVNDAPLPFADADGQRMRDTLVERGGFAPDRVVLLADPNTAEVRSRLRQIPKTAQALVYYVGPADEKDLHLPGALLPIDEIRQSFPLVIDRRTSAVIAGALRSTELTQFAGTPLGWPAPPPGALVVLDDRNYEVLDERRTKIIGEERTTTLALPPGSYWLAREAREITPLFLKVGDVVHAEALSYDRVSQLLTNDPAARRHEGLRLLAAGDLAMAKDVFAPGDRARARVLVKMAAATQGDAARPLLAEAIQIDPTLPEDPDFAPLYARWKELEAQARRDEDLKAGIKKELESNPRATRNWGLELDVISTRGPLVVSGSVDLKGMIFPSAGLDLVTQGVTADVRFVPFSWRVSPYVQVGGHYRFIATGWFGKAHPDASTGDLYEINWMNVHAEAGLEYFGTLGFAIRGGLGIIAYEQYTGGIATTPMPSFSFSWYFPIQPNRD